MNPKDAIGRSKLSASYMPWAALPELVLACEEGGFKYGKHNYDGSDIFATVYLDAIFRHHLKFMLGEDRDPETGVHHLAYIAANALISLQATIRGRLIDDRPVALAGAIDRVGPIHSALRDMFPAEMEPEAMTEALRSAMEKLGLEAGDLP